MSMQIKIEVSIDLDDKRQMRLEGSAAPVEVDEIEKAAEHLTGNVVAKAIAGYNVVKETLPKSASAEDVIEAARRATQEAQGPPSERKPRPEDPDSMRTFGEDDDEEQP